MKKRGFTLIELLAVIVVLAIIALIAVPMVLNTIEKSKEGAAKASGYNYVEALENAVAINMIKGITLDGTYTLTTNGIQKIGEEEIIVPIKGDRPISGGMIVIDQGIVKTANFSINGYNLVYENDKMNISNSNSDNENTSMYKEYSLGTPVTLVDNTTWTVIETSDANTERVKLISNLYISPNVDGKTGTNMFVNKNYTMKFDNNGSAVWEDSSLKQYLDGTVKTTIANSLGITTDDFDITILKENELINLGCSITKNGDSVSAISCPEDNEWFDNIISSESWTGVSHGDMIRVFIINNDYFTASSPNDEELCGLRPIITISKNLIK